MSKSIYVAGHMGMVGSAIVRELSKDHNISLLLPPKSELDLTNSLSVKKFMQDNKPDEIYLAAAKRWQSTAPLVMR